MRTKPDMTTCPEYVPSTRRRCTGGQQRDGERECGRSPDKATDLGVCILDAAEPAQGRRVKQRRRDSEHRQIDQPREPERANPSSRSNRRT